MPSLFVIQGRDQGQRFPLDEPSVSIGRVAGNSIQLHDTEVSRKHAVLDFAQEEYLLRDLNSSNGTFVNGKAVRQKTLRSGDQVQMGRTLLLYTGSHKSAFEAESDVHIFSAGERDDGSRILHAMSPSEGSDLMGAPINQTQSPWLARAKSNLQLMYRTSLAVSHTLDIDQLLARIMEMIFEWVDADRGCIMLKDEQTGLLQPRVRRHRRGIGGAEESSQQLGSDEEEKAPRIAISQTILDYVVERSEGVLTSNAGADERWDPAGSIMQMGVREAICVPMQGRYEQVGVIYIDTSITPKEILERRKANKFGEDHLKLMIAIAHQAALAVEDTSHYRAMVQAERLAAVGQTIATLSHHIKNILQGVRGGSYLIELGLGDHEKALNAADGEAPDLEGANKAVETVHKGWGIVEKNQERISSLVMDMLSFSKERKPDPEPANLNEVVADVVELTQARANEAGVQLVWEPDESLPQLLIDPEAVHRAALNIAGNAVDACEGRDPARVEIATHHDTQKSVAVVTFRDTGVGIPEDQRESIFNAFVSNKGSRGTGLGLPVSRKIAEEHGGTVRVDSEIEVGSTFTLELPIGSSPASQPEQEQVAELIPTEADGNRPVTPTP